MRAAKYTAQLQIHDGNNINFNSLRFFNTDPYWWLIYYYRNDNLISYVEWSLIDMIDRQHHKDK